MTRRSLRVLTLVGLALSLCGQGAAAAAPSGAPADDRHMSTTIIRGAEAYPTSPTERSDVRPGDVSFNFPAADVRDLAKAILGDMLGQTYVVEPEASGSVTLVTAQPIARADVLPAFEAALRASNLALLRRGGAYVITRLADARAASPMVAPGDPGYGSETIELRFIAAAQLKQLLDPIAPDAITIADATRNIITVTGMGGQRQSIRELITQFDTDWLRGMSFGLYVPKHTDARIIAPEVNRLLNGEGAPSAGLVRLIAMEKINGVLAVSAQPQYLDDVKRWIEVLDREGESSEPRLFVYRVQNGRSSDLATVLNGAFGSIGGRRGGADVNVAEKSAASAGFDVDAAPRPPALVAGAAADPDAKAVETSAPVAATITSDETNNAVLVYATPREYAVIEDALLQLDIPPVQVLIEAAITEVTLNHDLAYGVEWSFRSKGSHYDLLPNAGSVTSPASNIDPSKGNLAANLISAAQSLPGFNYLYTNGGSITATLNALSGLTTVNVLSAPKMLVLNNHTASLEVGDQVPIVTASSVSTIGTNAPTVNSVDYRDTGVILKVTPRVNSGGLVLLDIAQEVSDVTSTSTSSINSPTIEQRKFATSVAVQDGQTIALGGLIRDTRTKNRSGLPLLSSIPLLGALAGSQGTSDTRTELLILLTPRVVRSATDSTAVTEELRRKIQAIEPIAPIKSLRP
jgi:general secretion pathway protein D